jgi:hypothetical protein
MKSMPSPGWDISSAEKSHLRTAFTHNKRSAFYILIRRVKSQNNKDAALVSTIAIYDLTMQAQAVIAETFLTFELWFTVAGMYLVVTITLSFIVNWMEHHFKVVT